MSEESNVITKKKKLIPVSAGLRKYLKNYTREKKLPTTYGHLLDYDFAAPLLDKTGKDTLWETVSYTQEKSSQLDAALTSIYMMLKTEGEGSRLKHLTVSRIDYCTFGNSNPFRVRIINKLNDNYDYFYVKQADASRIYGLELEHILSPNRINYYVDRDTLIEEHIAGIPGDQFINTYLGQKQTNKVRIAKEFVKFNERCFVRLLGDMRSYNYVVDITPDFDDIQYRIRAIDFDQQSYEGRKNLYLPQFFVENNKFVQLGMELLASETVQQYQNEERSLIARRLKVARHQTKDLIDVLVLDDIAPDEKTNQLKAELAEHYGEKGFLKCRTMGEVVKKSLRLLLRGHLK